MENFSLKLRNKFGRFHRKSTPNTVLKIKKVLFTEINKQFPNKINTITIKKHAIKISDKRALIYLKTKMFLNRQIQGGSAFRNIIHLPKCNIFEIIAKHF